MELQNILWKQRKYEHERIGIYQDSNSRNSCIFKETRICKVWLEITWHNKRNGIEIQFPTISKLRIRMPEPIYFPELIDGDL